MNKKAKTRFMKFIVWFCILFTALVIVACYVAAWFGVDMDSVLTHTCAVFGGELLLTVVLRLLEKDDIDKGKGGTNHGKSGLEKEVI